MSLLFPLSRRWNTSSELEDFHKRLDSLFADESLSVAQWAPRVDIVEDEKSYLIKAELPEVKKDDVKVTVQNGILTISGERKAEKEEKSKKFHRVERSYGSFTRSFTLPEDTDPERVSADFKDGLLKVILPKSETARSRSVEVKVA